MKLRCILILVLGFLFAGPSHAGADSREKTKRILQTNINASILVTDFSKMSKKLNDLIRQYNGTALNLSINQNETSGSASMQIDPGKAATFMSELSQLGTLESQNLSTSDYTSSYEEIYAKVRLYEALSHIDLDSIASNLNLSDEERRQLKDEFQMNIYNQLRSYKSSLQSYANYGSYAQVSLSFRKAQSNNIQSAPPAELTGINVQNGTIEDRAKHKDDSGSSNNLVIPLYVIVFINFLFILVLYKQIKRTPMGS